MALTESDGSLELSCIVEDGVSSEKQEQMSASTGKRGGWVTFPFIAGTLMGLTIAMGGWAGSLVVYMIEKFHVKSINATQIYNITAACTSLLPVIVAIISDSFVECYSFIWVSALVSTLGITLLALTAMLNPLRPQSCENGSNFCPTATKLQFGVLFCGVTLASIGLAGSRFTIAAMGANQFDDAADQGIFFNWFAITMYGSIVLGGTILVYIEENVSWALGYCLCIFVNIIGLAIFLSGSRYYRPVKPQGSPFKSIARVLIATMRKWKVSISSSEDYYHEKNNHEEEVLASGPTKSFRFLNRAALRIAGDTRPDGSIAKIWRLCTVKQVEDLKTILRIFPVVSSNFLLCTAVPTLCTFTVLQALTLDRHLGSHFKFPAGSMFVIILTSTSITISLIDRFLYPMWKKMTRQTPRPLQRIALGHIFNMTGMGVAALVESKRLKVARSHGVINQPASSVPMLVLWLMPQLLVVGIGEAFHYPGQVTFYYQQFPKSLRSTSTAMVSLVIGVAYLSSIAVVDLVQTITVWLPDNINEGRLDNLYWLFATMEMVNFGYFLICARCYNYRNMEN